MNRSELGSREPGALSPPAPICRFREKTRFGLSVLAGVLLLFLSAGTPLADTSAGDVPAGWMEASLAVLARGSSQVLVVTGDDPSRFRATLHVFEKTGAGWRYAFPPVPALIGQKGFAPPGEKREGDLRTPSGVFPLRRTFGYDHEIRSRMPYRRVGKDDLWVDDASSPDYNRWVRRGETSASSFEVMRLDDDRYKYVIVMEYNTDPVVPGAGSAIFIHVRRGENLPTLGCVALSEGDILKILAWLDPQASPVAVLGTRESLISLGRGGGVPEPEKEKGR